MGAGLLLLPVGGRLRDGASDHGLHTLGVVLVAAGLAVLLPTVLDRRLMGRGTDRGTGTPDTPDTIDSGEALGAEETGGGAQDVHRVAGPGDRVDSSAVARSRERRDRPPVRQVPGRRPAGGRRSTPAAGRGSRLPKTSGTRRDPRNAAESPGRATETRTRSPVDQGRLRYT
ncbi:hypothetical protein GCM10010433_45060 [Streptomyces pulveraceus]